MKKGENVQKSWHVQSSPGFSATWPFGTLGSSWQAKHQRWANHAAHYVVTTLEWPSITSLHEPNLQRSCLYKLSCCDVDHHGPSKTMFHMLPLTVICHWLSQNAAVLCGARQSWSTHKDLLSICLVVSRNNGQHHSRYCPSKLEVLESTSHAKW